MRPFSQILRSAKPVTSFARPEPSDPPPAPCSSRRARQFFRSPATARAVESSFGHPPSSILHWPASPLARLPSRGDDLKTVGTAQATAYVGKQAVVTGAVAQVSFPPGLAFRTLDKPCTDSPFTGVICGSANQSVREPARAQGQARRHQRRGFGIQRHTPDRTHHQGPTHHAQCHQVSRHFSAPANRTDADAAIIAFPNSAKCCDTVATDTVRFRASSCVICLPARNLKKCI